MALRTIVQDGDPILKKKCRPVTNFDDRLAELLDDMIETLADAQGYGLAGPQVGVMRRVFVSLDERDLPEDGELPEGYEPKYLEFVNPEIIMQEGEVLQARCICHETNHLDGVTIMDLAEFFYEDQEHDDEDESATEE